MPSDARPVDGRSPSRDHGVVDSRLPSIDEAHYRVAPTTVVELGPVVGMWEATGGDVSALRVDRLPISSTSLWSRPAVPDPLGVTLRLHFDVKAALGFEHAVISRYLIDVQRRSRVGDVIGHHQVLRCVGPERMTALGWGRSWTVDHVLIDADGQVLQTEAFTAVGYHPSMGVPRGARLPQSGSDEAQWTIRSLSRAAAACRVWSPVHHDPGAARRSGLPGVIACTQHLAAMLEQDALRNGNGTGVDRGRGRGGGATRLDLRMRRTLFATRAT